MKLTKEDLNKSLEIQFQKDLKDLLEVVDLYNKSNKMLFENRLSKEEYETLNEGLWEKVKYGLSKLGRYKAGGKILGKGKIDQEAAVKIQTIIDKKGNEMIKALNSSIKEKNPEFPNNKKGQDFLNTVLEISAVYDSVVAATKKDPKEEGFLPIDAANTIIEDLAEYVKKFLDVDLSAAYSVMDSEKEKVDKDTELLIDEVEDINEDEAEDVRTKLQAKKGDAADRDSERMKTLKSNKLPLLLTAVGGSLGALGWLAQTDWLKTLLESWLNKKGIPGEDAIYQTFTGGHGGDPKGFLHWANQIDPSNPMKTGADVSNFVNKMGAENVSHMFDGNGAGDSMDQVSKLQQLVGGDNANKSVGELFQGDTYGDMKQGRNLFGISKAASFTAKVLIKQAVKGVAGSTAGTVLATKIAGVGSVLAPLGIAVLATGALVKLMRMKGQKQSRAKTLQDLLNSIQPIKGTEQNQPVLPEQPKEEKSGSGTDNEQLFNDLSKFFQFVVNNKKFLNTKGTLSGDALVSKKDRDNPCYGLKPGVEVSYTSKSGEKSIHVVKQLLGNGEVQIKKKNSNDAPFAINCSKVKKINENIMKNNTILIEGKFIKDKRTLEYLTKKSSVDKIKKFEEFLTRLEFIRNKVKKMGNTEDKVINNFVKKMKSNPIIATDFVKMFNVPSDNPKGVQSLKGFIDELFSIIYSGKNKKMVNMVDKMATLGGGNINKMEESYLYEEKGYNADEPNKSFLKDAQDRGSFKKHLNNFIFELMNMFQYLYKLKKEGNLSGGTKKPTKTKPEPKQESVKKVNPLLTEEINKIKNLMFKIS
jgi:hypothetical protein